MPFYFYTIVLGMVIGAVLTWFLVADHPFESREAPGGPVDPLEAGTIAGQLKTAGIELDEPTIERVLQLHGAYVVGEVESGGGYRAEERSDATAAEGEPEAETGGTEAKTAADKDA